MKLIIWKYFRWDIGKRDKSIGTKENSKERKLTIPINSWKLPDNKSVLNFMKC